MTPLVQEVVSIIRQRLSARYTSAQTDRKNAIEVLTSQLDKLDAEWARTEYWHTRKVSESSSQAWTDSLEHLHAGRKKKYQEAQADLADHLSQLNSMNLEDSFNEAIVDVAITSIETEISSYSSVLSVKRRQGELKGEYGDVDNSRWISEARKFVTKNPNVSSAISALQELDSSLELGIDWMSFVVNFVDQNISPAIDLADVPPADGIGFEHACADILEKCGWVVTITRASGDQGVDLLAKKEGFIVAVQCKNTTQPVGNAAVQEVYAGRAFYEATAAVVVSRAGFTSSAVQLANRLSVALVDSANLADLDRYL